MVVAKETLSTSPRGSGKTVARRRTIAPEKRFGVWKAWSGKCFWCLEPVPFQNSHIDHALPIGAAEKVGGMDKLRELYSLPGDFELESFSNWVPACAGCNQAKANLSLVPSPMTTVTLVLVRSRAGYAKDIAVKIKNDIRKASLLAKLAVAITAGDITQVDIRQLLDGLPLDIQRGAAGPEEVLFIAPGWKVVRNMESLDFTIIQMAECGR